MANRPTPTLLQLLDTLCAQPDRIGGGYTQETLDKYRLFRDRYAVAPPGEDEDRYNINAVQRDIRKAIDLYRQSQSIVQ